MHAHPVTRRRNAALFEYLCGQMSDAELRTMEECVAAETEFRAMKARSAESGRFRTAPPPNEPVMHQPVRRPSGIRPKVA